MLAAHVTFAILFVGTLAAGLFLVSTLVAVSWTAVLAAQLFGPLDLLRHATEEPQRRPSESEPR